MTDCAIAVVGCGKQGEKHLQALAGLGVQSVCCDLDPALSGCVAARFGARSCDIEAAIADPAVQGLVIATPTRSHYALARQGLAAGKHIFCEKPLTATLAEAEALAKLEPETNRFVMSGYIYRFVPAFERIRQLIDAGTLGAPAHALLRIGGRGEHRVWKHRQADGGGVVNEMLVHMLDLALWLFGPLHDVRVLNSAVLLPERAIAGERVKVDADDYVVVGGQTADGAPVTFIADMVSPGFTQFLDGQFENASVMASIQPAIADQLFLKAARDGLKAGAQPLAPKAADLYDRQMQSFLQVVESGTPPDRNRLADTIEMMKLLATLHEQTGSGGH